MSGATSAFRDRKLLFSILLTVLGVNVVLLLSYRTFYDVRLRSLVSQEESLRKTRDEARRAADEAVASERKLFETQETLTAFFSETLGKREERIAPLIEEIYRTTRETGLRPDSISYTSVEQPGTDSLTMNFSVAGPYGDVKRLLAGLEKSKRFLVVDHIGLSGGIADDPNAVRISITVTNYFRPGALRPIRTVRDTRAGARVPASRGRAIR